MAGKCVDVAGANSAGGTPVQLYDCNGTADGSTVQLWDCTGGPNQKWTVTGAHDIVNPQADKCLDVTGNNSANGTRLQIWTCSGGANQKWTVG
ncbi:MAG: ricin-type beta-trefoil lectin domain protein [Streptomyces sp.]|nr:ricin-type beta-trefoil lectin domain protein [Streptomyces sp.]